MTRRRVSLLTFLQGHTNPERKMPGCCNWDQKRGQCVFDMACLVIEGRRCGHFETAVLPTAAYTGQLVRITQLYERKVGAPGITGQASAITRSCPDCGGELKLRQRYCESCKKRRRRKSFQKARSRRNSLEKTPSVTDW